MKRFSNDNHAKRALRQTLLARRAALAPEFRAEAAAMAAQAFVAAVPCDGRVVSLYHAIRTELSTEPLQDLLAVRGCRICLPAVRAPDEPLEFRLWEAGQALVPSGFGTFAPQPGDGIMVPDIVVLPLLGFDARGSRLGYGAGCYDRTIARIAKPLTLVGYGYSCQEHETIPVESHDQRLDMVVTEAGCRHFGSNGASM